MEVVVISSGPSASKAVVPDDAVLIAVNGSYAVCPRRPDIWMIGEREAARTYADKAAEYHKQGTRILGRPFCREIIKCLEGVDSTLGPPFLHHLHLDVLGPALPGNHGLPANSRAWISSGVLAMWWALDRINPEKLTVYGVDGYQHKNVAPRHQQGEYASGVHAAERRPERTELYCEQMNWRAAEGIWAISNFYRDTEITMASRHQHYHTFWRVKLMEAA